MKKWLLGLLSLCLIGCTTPQPICDDLSLIRQNIQIQKKVATMLLNSVKPQNDKQIEALALKVMEVEQRFDRMASAHNRLVTYFGADRQVGYIINIINFMQESSLRELLGQAEGVSDYDTLCQGILLDCNILLSDNRMSGSQKDTR